MADPAEAIRILFVVYRERPGESSLERILVRISMRENTLQRWMKCRVIEPGVIRNNDAGW